jgi:hypothetical protein
MTIQRDMVSVKILKIGNILVSIGLLLKESIPKIGEAAIAQKNLKALGMIKNNNCSVL